MQYKLLAGAALAAIVSAQDTPAESSAAAELLSVVSVLQTALPSSLIQEALTNSAGVSSELASEFAAGQTPSWFTALPSDVQTYLVPGAVATANATAITTASGAPYPSANSTGNSTTSRSTRSSGMATLTSSSSTGSSETGAAATGSNGSSSSSSAGASMPTAIVGMGLAGAVGFVGLLAL